MQLLTHYCGFGVHAIYKVFCCKSSIDLARGLKYVDDVELTDSDDGYQVSLKYIIILSLLCLKEDNF